VRNLIIALAVAVGLASSARAQSKEPAAQVEALVHQMQSGKSDGVFMQFFAGSLLAKQKPTEIRAMDGQAKAALEFYGKPVAYELLDAQKIGASLVRMKWITKHKDDSPLFWNALFYRRQGKWEPLNVVFFDDPTKALL